MPQRNELQLWPKLARLHCRYQSHSIKYDPPPYINVGMTVCTGIECWDILLLFETNIELGGSGEFDVSPVILSQLENMPILLFKCQGILASCRQLKFKHTHGWVILFCVN